MSELKIPEHIQEKIIRFFANTSVPRILAEERKQKNLTGGETK